MYDHQKIEQQILDFWEKNKIFQKLMKKNKGNKPFSLIDGPITANNPMGVHHAWGRTLKDLYQRWKAMQGFDQRFQNGFDCQGLWLEVETEKELGFNSKKDIENFGLEKFSKACRERVNKFSKIQTQQSIRLGQWLDFGNDYYTMSDDNIQTIWFFLKKCHEKKWLYKGKRILPWCIRCGTSSSKHEMSDEGYAELVHPSIYVKAKLKGKKNEYLLIWTTTEFTLSSNVAAAVNPNIDYAQVQSGGEIYILSKSTLNNLKKPYKILKTIKGSSLMGLSYESFYPEFEVQKEVRHKIIASEEINDQEGTGIVHIAPNCGEIDYELGKKNNLKILNAALDDFGNYNKGYGWLTGKNVKEAKEEIVKELDKRGILYSVENYKHRYPICWRCKEELVFRLDSSWFISCDEIRPFMKKEAAKVTWSPEHVGKAMQDWLDNMEDWNISRKRYWGLPLMFYECSSCGNLEVIGSLKELKEKAINKKDVDKLPELHRPWIDIIRIKCSCGQEVERIKEVGDCWLDAGIVPFSTLRYFSDKSYWKKWFPANLEIEGKSQVRLWFYSQLFMAVALEGISPYKKILANEDVRDEKGEPMHKSKGNVIWFDEAVEKMGADVMRWNYCSQNAQYPLHFGYRAALETENKLTLLFNLTNYMQQVILQFKKPVKLEKEDQWLLSKLNSLIEDVTSDLENLKPYIATRKIEEFFTVHLSRTYIQIARERMQTDSGRNKDAAIFALYHSILTIIKLLAPFTPFLTERLYQENFRKKEKKESIHLFEWPKAEKRYIKKTIEADFEITKGVIQELLAQREKAKLGIRWPLQEATIEAEKPETKKALMFFSYIIQKQVNVKKINLKEGKELKIMLNTTLTPILEQEGFSREVMRRIQDLRKKAKLEKKDRIELVIFSAYDISAFKKEIQEVTGAKTLSFTKPTKKYELSSKEEIKGNIFEIYFERI